MRGLGSKIEEEEAAPADSSGCIFKSHGKIVKFDGHVKLQLELVQLILGPVESLKVVPFSYISRL